MISRLLFPNDTLICCKDSANQLAYLGWILFWFETISSLRIDLSKSALIPVGNAMSEVELATKLGCQLGSLSSEYLGLPLWSKFNTSSIWDKVEERFRKRLAMWKKDNTSRRVAGSPS